MTDETKALVSAIDRLTAAIQKPANPELDQLMAELISVRAELNHLKAVARDFLYAPGNAVIGDELSSIVNNKQ